MGPGQPGKGQAPPSQAEFRPCSPPAPGAPASLRLHLLVMLGVRERQVAEMCTFPIAPALGGTSPPGHGCPLHVAHSLQVFPGGTTSSKSLSVHYSCSNPHSLQPVAQPKLLPFGKHGDKWGLGSSVGRESALAGTRQPLAAPRAALCDDVAEQQALCHCLYLCHRAVFPDRAAGSSQTQPSPCLSWDLTRKSGVLAIQRCRQNGIFHFEAA